MTSLFITIIFPLTANQISFNSDNSNSRNKCSMFNYQGMHSIKVNSLWLKKEELRHLAQLENASVIGINETKLDKSLSKGKTVILTYDLMRLDRSGREVVLLASSNTLSNKVINPKYVLTQKVFLQRYFLPKSKPFMQSIQYTPRSKIDFADCIDQIFSQFNTLKIQECYILWGTLMIRIYTFRVNKSSAIKLDKRLIKRCHL